MSASPAITKSRDSSRQEISASAPSPRTSSHLSWYGDCYCSTLRFRCAIFDHIAFSHQHRARWNIGAIKICVEICRDRSKCVWKNKRCLTQKELASSAPENEWSNQIDMGYIDIALNMYMCGACKLGACIMSEGHSSQLFLEPTWFGIWIGRTYSLVGLCNNH